MALELTPDPGDSDILRKLFQKVVDKEYFVCESKDDRFWIARVGSRYLLESLHLQSPSELSEVDLVSNTMPGFGDTREEAVRIAMERWEEYESRNPRDWFS